ncbi:hypothetical protein K3725_10970 [Leisingera sp. S132]|uniref:hypothetical protein n=1 Tax=Leisingera sp. S132 TaxID=2867016 RepID=UPI0021A74374|nr:hypothetical protein [Leisingera sp. S132]UWQ77843.1 hypothetical protein K3725_10970 [Leisingera sp. S132]
MRSRKARTGEPGLDYQPEGGRRLPVLKDVSQTEIEEINSWQFPLTVTIEQTSGTLLRVAIGAGAIGGEAADVAGITGLSSIEAQADSPAYVFEFENFVSYAVTDEMYAQNSKEEIGQGNWISIYTRSHFLDFVRKSTWASTDYPGELTHYQINTLDHTVDVVCYEPVEFSAA